MRGAEIVATGQNKVITTTDPTAHAEILAIRRACHRLASVTLEGCTLYVSSQPCSMCLQVISRCRIQEVHYLLPRTVADRYGFMDCVAIEISQMICCRKLSIVAEEPFRLWTNRPRTLPGDDHESL